MAMMKFEVPHSLSQPEARKRVEQLLKYWGGKYGVQASWAGEAAKVTGKVMGINLDASFQVTDRAVEGEGTDPGMLLRGQAKSYLQKKFSAVLDPSKSAADLNNLD